MLAERCRQVELILSDVDGVLTDGGIIYDSVGGEAKRFHIRDGMGIKLWQRAGKSIGIVTGRKSPMVERRMRELGITLLRQGSEAKLPIVREIAEELRLSPEQICYIGDDLPDLPAIQFVGLGVAVADAAADVRAAADYTTALAGGCGAVREVIEMILHSQDRWDEVLAAYQLSSVGSAPA